MSKVRSAPSPELPVTFRQYGTTAPVDSSTVHAHLSFSASGAKQSAARLASAAAADRVTVKGTVLEGTVKSISAKQVVMTTVYGKGDLAIGTEDVSAIETDAPFHVYKADDGTEVGPVVGVTPAAVTESPMS